MANSSEKGFTLVELAIVLVIIGLIVSSVLVGQDLIKSAELRATTTQLQQFQAAVNTFIGKYNGIPGDLDGYKYGLQGGCGDADRDGSISGAEVNANGDTILEGDGVAAPSTANMLNGSADIDHDGEIACFWANLTSEGKELIPGFYEGTGVNAAEVGVNMPQMKFGNAGWGVFGLSSGADRGNYFVTGVIGGSGNQYNTRTVFQAIDALNIDEKIDDGIPSTGSVKAVGANNNGAPASNNGSDFTQGPAGSTTTHCQATNPSPHEYQTATTTPNCNLRFKMETF